MNTDLQKKRKKKEKENEKVSSENRSRSPLLDLNKFTTKRRHFSTSSSSFDASKSSKSAPGKRPESVFSNKSGNLRSKSSKENILPRPISLKPKTSQKSSTKSGNLGKFEKNQRYGSDQRSLNRNGSGKQPIKLFNLDNSFENCTPVGKLASGSGFGLDFAKFDCENMDAKSDTSVIKTPPIEVSLSPEIPNGLSAAVLASAATTPCYGAGHILSGVADRRKCRPRGVLTVGPMPDSSSKCVIADESDKESLGNVVLRKSRMSFVPLPVEASVSWLSSPSGEEDGVCKSNSASRFQELSMSSSEKDPNLHRLRKSSCSFVWDSSPHSTSTLSCGNVIQTPNSDSSSGRRFGLSWFDVDEHHKRVFEYELDEVTKSLCKASLSPQNQMPTCDVPEMCLKFNSSSSTFGFNGTADHPIHRDAASTSLLSESSFGNISESNMRISWRDGLVSQVFERDELDCCIFLSDEENDNVCCTDEHQMANQTFQGSDFDENGFVIKSGLKPPEFLEEEPCIHGNTKGKLSPQRPSSCAESIFTDGGGLVSSSTDSDWTLCSKNQLFNV